MRFTATHLKMSIRMSMEGFGMNKSQCQTVIEIMNSLKVVELKRKPGGKFNFPIYMTQSMRDRNIEDLDLSARAYNCLKRAGYNTIGELTQAVSSGIPLKSIRNCGTNSVMEIMSSLFLFQYNMLSAEHRYEYLMDVVRANVRS